MGSIVTYHGALICHGRFVSEAVGEAAYRANNPNSSYATALEGAKSDAIGRCCKDLSMFSELWDKAWLDQFVRTKCETYTGRKKNRDGQWEDAKLWRRKDHATRKPPEDLDLMSGAGGREPDAPSAPASSPAATQPDAGGAGSDQAGAGAPTSDTGEAANPEGYAAVAAQFKRLKYTRGGVRVWLKNHFGQESVEALTADQAAAAIALLGMLVPGVEPVDTPMYQRVLERLRAEGKVRS
jgi:hypothetical protein